MGDNAESFGIGHASGANWRAAAEACAAQLDPPAGANLGFVYVTDAIAGEFGKIIALLVQETGVVDWVGTTGVGICATGREYFDEPAVAAMVGCFPDDGFSVFDRFGDDHTGFLAGIGPWAARGEGHFAVVHADPRDPEMMRRVPELAEAAGCFLVGGLASSRGAYGHVAGALTEGALSGVMFSAEVPVVTALTQGCSPIGPVHEVTQCHANLAIEIDGRAALGVLKDGIGEVLAQDLQRIRGYIFAAFPIADSDTGDYLVRNLTGIDPNQGWISVAEPVEPGRRIQFCRRDHDAALTDLKRMVRDVKARAGAAPKAGLYFSCIARGPSLFGSESEELRLIEAELGAIPLAGFFGNGEIFNNRLYTFTGVLVLFV